MKNAFNFTLKALKDFEEIKIFVMTFFGYVEKRLDQKDKFIFKICDITTCETNNCNAYIAQYLSRSKGNQTMKLDQLIEYSMRNIFLEK